MFHPGELEMQRRAGSQEDAQEVGRILASHISQGAARFLARQRLAAAASLDSLGRVWASLLTGAPGFIETLDSARLRITPGRISEDPLFSNIEGDSSIGLIVLDPATFQRMRVNGRAREREGSIIVSLGQIYGNCPKYIHKRRFAGAAATTAPLVEPASMVDERLNDAEQSRVARADTFFIASTHPEGGADVSHRGGPPGFVQVGDDRTLTFPDYPGNGLFNTLGNLVANPRAGLLFPDFETGDVLQMTGKATIGSDFAVRFVIDEVRDRQRASPLRYELLSHSRTLGI